ncbi:hypothetical protein H8S90_23620 [Olivibacter sp. SDN3]|uniref:hypothetical protein n=1 Tax=Olivibacter sp. SDN3 TaxID=2764720 RepID=UPI0016517CB2|nr:hypothetical protein [Olivibacter sp. SDN3]QNL49669.1 hypothetical protein H8S90_23620 [Olivibacter sp. SDN3]
MKCYLFLVSLIFAGYVSAQEPTFSAGSKVFVENTSKNENVINTVQELLKRLNEWDHWQVVPTAEEADFKISIDVTASKGITLTSWGGTSYVMVAKLIDKKNEVLWESNAYKSSPNGTNGFNSGRAVVKKLMRDLKRKFT